MIHRTTRSILSVLLAALLLVTSIPLTPAFAGGGGVSLQSANSERGGLEPAADGTYLIYTAENLKEFAAIVNGTDGTSTDSDANAKLMNDIDLSSVCGPKLNDGSSVSWTPIGSITDAEYSDSLGYTGTFDGNGKTISGLYIKSTADYQGLFGRVSGTVQNLSVSGEVSGNRYVGGVVGDNRGTVENCHNIGEVSGNRYVGGVVGYNGSSGTVKNCYNTGTITGTDDYVVGVVGYNNGGTVENCHNIGDVIGNRNVGGVVGRNGGNVINCTNTGSVKGRGIHVGGVVGNNGGRVTNCYNIGEVSGTGNRVGGVVGYNSSIVENCYNTGTVTGTDERVGGVVGNNDGSVTNCYNTGEVTGSTSGGVVGYNSGTVKNCYFLKTETVNTQLQGIGSDGGSDENAAPVTNLNNQNQFKDWDFADTWRISDTLKRPVLTSNHEDDGSKDHPYEIFTATQLENFRDLVNGEDGQTADPDAHAKLMNDIDLEGNEKNQWTPIGNDAHQYIGTFDGNGKTISGLYIDSSADYQGLLGYGLFGYVSGTVQNLTVSGTVTGSGEDVGGIAGQNNGNVINCTFSGSVSGGDVGGVVGDNSGIVTNCYNTGSVSGYSNAVGGVVGWNDNGSVENCYNIGEVSGSGSGGIVGNNTGSAIVTNCYYQNDKASAGIGGSDSETDEAIAKDEAEFHSGEVAYLLGEAWGQNLMNEPKDNYPQLRAFDADTPQVYKVAFMNDSKEHDAKYANNGMTVGSPTTNPTKEGYTFAGWKDENDSVPSFPITVNSDTTYTAKWTPHTYSITASPSALNFGSITEGEERPAAQNVTITNTGNQRVTLDQPTATNFEIGKLSETTLEPDETATFTIQPKDKLPRGSYSEQITITGDNNVSETLTASFTVKEPPYTGKYSYEVFTSVGDNGAISVDRYATEGDKVTIDVTPDQAYKLDELVVTANGKDVELTANGDGTYTFTMPSADVRITATFAEDPDWTEPEEPTTDVSDLFIDIAPDAWYKDAIQYAYDNGLMTGVSDTEFAPEATTTRAMIVSILARLEGVTTAQAAGFADVDDEWYATAVNWAANVGVVNGYEDNTFRPNTAITREQLAAILMNYAAYKGEDVSNRASLTSYTDQPSTWAEEAMSWAVAEGLISGVTADTLQPQGAATRAQVAAILQRFLSE